MPRSSHRSARVYILKPEHCRLRGACWVLAHGLAVAGIAGTGLPAAARVVLVALAVAHCLLRRPPRAPLLLVTDAGRWSVPGRGLYERRAGTRSAYTSLWVRLALESCRRGETFVLLRPEYSGADWRRIQLALRAGADESS